MYLEVFIKHNLEGATTIFNNINTIFGGFLEGGCIASHRKKYAWEVMEVEAQVSDQAPEPDLIFTKADL